MLLLIAPTQPSSLIWKMLFAYPLGRDENGLSPKSDTHRLRYQWHLQLITGSQSAGCSRSGRLNEHISIIPYFLPSFSSSSRSCLLGRRLLRGLSCCYLTLKSII